MFSLLQRINLSCTAGPNAVSNHVLEKCAGALVPFLVIVFNKSPQDNELPSQWKLTNAVPIHKSPSKQLVMPIVPFILQVRVGNL